MRRLIALALLGLLLGLAVVVLYGLGRAGVETEARRLKDDAAREQRAELEATRDALTAELDALLAREGQRAWWEWRAAYLPPDLVATNVALIPSRLVDAPEDPFVRLYFEARDGALTAPCFFEGVPDPPPASPYAGFVARELALLAPLVPLLEAGARPRGEPPRRELVDRFVCDTNGAPDVALWQLSQAPVEPAVETQMKGEWDAYQNRAGRNSGQYRGQQAAPETQRPPEDVPVDVYPFRLVAHGQDALGWPETVLAVRRISVAGLSWTQGFQLDVRWLREERLPALGARGRTVVAPPPRWELARVEGSLPEVSRRAAASHGRVCVVPVRAAPPGVPAVRLAAPFDGLALVDQCQPAEARDLLAGTRALLDGALALAVLVVLAGGAILVVARSERRLAQQRSDFVAALTHELKAPITGFRALTELLHDDLVPDEAKKREYYAAMLAESERLSRLVQNVLDASQLERGALRVAAEPQDPAPVLLDLASRFRPRLESEGFTVDVDVPDDLPRAGRRPRGARAHRRQPARQRGQVRPRRRAAHPPRRARARRLAARRDPRLGAGRRLARPAARLRPLLPRRRAEAGRRRRPRAHDLARAGEGHGRRRRPRAARGGARRAVRRAASARVKGAGAR
jgi:hypothetical protein